MYTRKIVTALLLLLICSVLLVSASFAWIALSRAPEITGVDTNVGTNGSLEIALLSDRTYMDPSLIQTSVGDSVVVQDATVSNLSWGNIVDLSHESYGLSKVTMLPARLNVLPGEGGRYVVAGNMLSLPSYGLDGRFTTFNADTVSAVYNGSQFSYLTNHQSYGVRAIGSVASMTPQQAALATARTAVRSYTSAAGSAAASVWKENGPGILELCFRRYSQNSDSFTDANVTALRQAATHIYGVFDYLDSALRQGIIGYAASMIDDVETFKTLRSTVENPRIPLSTITDSIPAGLPSEFQQWITDVESGKAQMQQVISGCNTLSGGAYTWTQISPLLGSLLDADEVYLNESKLSSSEAYQSITKDNALTVSSYAGVLAVIADFVGDTDIFMTYAGAASVQVQTMSLVSPPHLTQMANILDTLQADGTQLGYAQVNDIHGFAVDFAFRCNTRSDLLLQTFGSDRVDADSDNPSTQGSGSYMKFSSEQMTNDQVLKMMDAVRIAFLDNRNTILSIAKLNTSNYTQADDGSITAPLYLYDFTVTEGGSIVTGQRLEEDAPIMSLSKSVATVVTVVVWLDGDYVDNSVAGITAKSMSSTLNLQFGSSADLVASGNQTQGESGT